jgi:CBS domain containing-hemolysin-like protein
LLVNDKYTTAKKALRELRSVQATELAGEVVLQMQANRETLLLVVDDDKKTIGVLSIDQLTDPLLNGPLVSLKR